MLKSNVQPQSHYLSTVGVALKDDQGYSFACLKHTDYCNVYYTGTNTYPILHTIICELYGCQFLRRRLLRMFQNEHHSCTTCAGGISAADHRLTGKTEK